VVSALWSIGGFMYKTSVITDEISQDLKVAAQMAREYGFIYNGQYDEYLNMKL
jgi:hypothetical protein